MDAPTTVPARPVRVLHVTTVDLSLRYLLLNQMKAIRAAGYEVTACSAPGPHLDAIRAEGIPHLPVPWTRKFSLASDARAFLSLWRLLRRERFDVVHTHTPKPGVLGQLAARLAGVPVVVNTVHGFYYGDDTPPWIRRVVLGIEKAVARLSDDILFQSREDLDTALREGFRARQSLVHLGNGIDVERFAPGRIDARVVARLREAWNLRPGDRVVGFVGRLLAEKGVGDLLAAAESVLEVEPAMRLLLIGPRDEKGDGIDLATVSPRLRERIVAPGLVQEMPEAYSLMDVFVLPSYREGYPRVIMEASAMGIPVVATDIRGCREAVVHGQTGLLVPRRSPHRLAAAILEILRGGEAARAMGRCAAEDARSRFDERAAFRTVLASYARCLARARVSAPACAADGAPGRASGC